MKRPARLLAGNSVKTKLRKLKSKLGRICCSFTRNCCHRTKKYIRSCIPYERPVPSLFHTILNS
ncbi:hypothetical protein I7I53_01931 [Histoplasma capsulatum var. duboisii H88]|uniref:Uncharacterized protein n=1 Tax=Ajellomyces capsulatus (strain H88) TaxID=544711 RepID=A0A8A1LLR4_AJEC8|nr:hypothetical protein I7I53_01931 [Histoplasma capsulatum var. duboisii H88]